MTNLSVVNSHDFIFSSQPAHRLSRHLLFWTCWLIIQYFTIWLPTYSQVFAPFYGDWNVHQLLQRLGERGWYASSIAPLIGGWYKGFLGFMILTYLILYVTLPGYFSKKKNKLFITVITLLIIAAFCGYQYIVMHSNYAQAVRTGRRSFMPSTGYMLAVTLKGITVAVPTVVGLAVSIKLIKRWWLKQKETEQIANQKATAELRLLKAQIHPHFLFNTLNNIYFFTLSSSQHAPEMIRKLSDMLSYILNECDHPTVPLQKEIKMIQDYMALEKIRYGDQMTMTTDIKGNLQNKQVAPLLLIPFVENSFKHGTSKMLSRSFVKLSINAEDDQLTFLLTNSKPHLPAHTTRNGSIGLKNVRKRLQLIYPTTHELNIVDEPGTFTVLLKIRVQETTKPIFVKEKAMYASA